MCHCLLELIVGLVACGHRGWDNATERQLASDTSDKCKKERVPACAVFPVKHPATTFEENIGGKQVPPL